jgi:hypothetical protein
MAAATAQTTWYVQDDAPNDPGPGDPAVSDPLEDGSQEHPFDAIQEGINAAVNGDTVLVLDGTYTGTGNRDLDFGGKLITVRSENGSETSIIDCEHCGRAFYFHSGETGEVVVDGFTIQQGYASKGSPGGAYGGGILNDAGSSPTVVNCMFSGNSAYWRGGGMCNRNGSSPLVTNCTFSDNHAWGFDGGGMFNDKGVSATVANCTFIGNVAHPDGVGSYGGGMRNLPNSVMVINCTFTGNWAVDGGGMDTASATVINCTFNGNSATSGGGICGNARATNCTFIGNSATRGGGIGWAHSSLTNCTFSANSAPYGAGIYVSGDIPTLTNCILWGDNGTEIDTASGTPVVTYCDVQGGYSGVGNINEDPLFSRSPEPGPDGVWGTEDDEYGDPRLQPGSPCIDAANNTAVPADMGDLDGDGDLVERTPLDLAGQPRFADDPDTTDTGIPDLPAYPHVVDMGACEFQLETYQPGDVNCDGEIDAFDIDPFVLALTDPAGYVAKYPDCDVTLADITEDGYADAFDIDPFVKLLTGG